MQRLPFANRDCASLGATLELAGFTSVTTMSNASTRHLPTRRKVMTCLRKMKETLPSDALLYVHLSTWGTIVPTSGPLLLCHDYSEDDPLQTSILQSELHELLRGTFLGGGPQVVLTLDLCYHGTVVAAITPVGVHQQMGADGLAVISCVTHQVCSGAMTNSICRGLATSSPSLMAYSASYRAI